MNFSVKMPLTEADKDFLKTTFATKSEIETSFRDVIAKEVAPQIAANTQAIGDLQRAVQEQKDQMVEYSNFTVTEIA